MSSDDIAISVKNINKSFKLPHEKQSSLKGLFINMFNGKRTYEKQQVLKDINFEIKKGEFFGIVGRNGSGKSTLLKLLAGIYTPDSGHIQINGKLTPFIELGVGFNPELTGRENVFLNGALLGFNRSEMEAMYDEIVEFAELEKFMDQKLKNYSSGMQVRLAFSIAIRANSAILLLDEVLAVGDTAFQQKCFNYFQQLKKDRATVCLVTHDMSAVEKFCDRALLINKGKIELIGKSSTISKQYEKLNFESILKSQYKLPSSDGADNNLTIEASIKGDKKLFKMEDNVVITIDIKSSDGLVRNIVPGININRKDSGQLVAASNLYTQMQVINFKDYKKFEYSFTAGQLTRGGYDIDVFVLDADNDYITISQKTSARSIKIIDNDRARWGAFNIEGRWRSSV